MFVEHTVSSAGLRPCLGPNETVRVGMKISFCMIVQVKLVFLHNNITNYITIYTVTNIISNNNN